MLFNSFEFLLFLPIVVALYWVLPRSFRAPLLLLASYFFYMSWTRIYGLLLFGMTVANYLLGLWLEKARTPKKKRFVLIVGIAVNLALLSLFKYTNFFLDVANGIGTWLSQSIHLAQPITTGISALPIILPLGISFFVFEFIHYLVDVSRGSPAIRSPVRFGLFASFFPSQIAGPIKRFQDFDQQVLEHKKFDGMLFQSGMLRIMQGMFKKVALGDNLAPIVQSGFAAPHAMATADAWVCMFAFGLQIYFDFSGYTDIGIGSAMLLGYRLPENFNLPYLARSIQEYWRKWHISLSGWLRDYLYLPLGGSRSGEFHTYKNLLITMVLCGLWHGAAWTYIVFGFYHGLALGVNRVWDKTVDRFEVLRSVVKTVPVQALYWLATILALHFGYVIFRAASLPDVGTYFHKLLTWHPTSSLAEGAAWEQFATSVLPVALTIYGAAYLWSLASPRLARAFGERWTVMATKLTPPVPARVIMAAGVALLIVGLAPQKSVPFYYFQF